jgi:hypothetical protein
VVGGGGARAALPAQAANALALYESEQKTAAKSLASGGVRRAKGEARVASPFEKASKPCERAD